MEFRKYENDLLNICNYDGNSYNYSIDASAGTGKTYTIEQIVMKCILAGISLRSILIVTYTEKAAGELRDRIRRRIETSLEDKSLSQDSRQYFREARAELEQTDICTIHSFCQKTLRLFAYDSGRTIEMELVDDSGVGALIDEMIRDEWPKNDYFRTLIDYSSNPEKVARDCKETIQNALKSYYLKPNGEEDSDIIQLEKIEIRFHDSDKVFSFEELAQYYTKCGKEALTVFPGVDEHFNILDKYKNDIYKVFKTTGKTKSVADFIENVLDRKGDYDGSNKGFMGGYTGDNPELKVSCDYFASLRDWIRDHLKDRDELLQQQFILQQIPVVYQAWRKRKSDARLQSYNDMIASVYEAIDGPLCDKLRKTYRIGIIDEFQDTNQMQWKIFEKLFLQSEENPDHQLIVVGDPKQSIYAFQNADVNVYMSATECFSGRLNLDTNYRSTDLMINACNELFSCHNGLPGFFDRGDKQENDSEIEIFFKNSSCPAVDKKIPEARFNGEVVPAVWLSKKFSLETQSEDAPDIQNGISPDVFASEVTNIILQCCNRDEQGKTCLQVYHKDTKELSNVSFRDFAILARSKPEMEPIKKSLSNAGIPYMHYKEDNLFSSRECFAWIALCKAIHAIDFSERNRKILTEALITDFFCVNLFDAENERYDSPLCKERMDIVSFQALARQSKWAAMLECIYQRTGIQNRLSDLTRLQELARIRQIGQYIVDRLYTKHCGLGDIIRHLQKLYQNGKATEDESANLVARNSDFDVVQVMSIHASKGLEFPIVIAVAGFRGFYDSRPNETYLYHKNVDRKCLGITKDAKIKFFEEAYLEWQRLFYVAYTRATSLLVIPQYSYEQKEFAFLNNTMANLEILKTKDPDKYRILFGQYRDDELLGKQWSEPVKVKDILHSDVVLDPTNYTDQQIQVKSMMDSISSRGLYQHSYSSLLHQSTNSGTVHSNETDEAAYDANDDFLFKGRDDAKDSVSKSDIPTTVSFIDKGISIPCAYSSTDRAPDYNGYPCGTKLGTAVHEVFERMDFSDILKDKPEQCDEVLELSRQSFVRAGLNISDNKVLEQTTSMIWNALHAELPVIHGGKTDKSSFRICDLKSNDHFPEVEFELNAGDSKSILKSFATGSIDLVFVRDEQWYSIVDWKTNLMTPDSLCNPDIIKENVDTHYAIQRVLYSYCLIQWLKSFYPNKTEDEIFNEHFGGIYYMYVRGCRAGTGNGVYAHTWESFEKLENSYLKIKTLMTSKV